MLERKPNINDDTEMPPRMALESMDVAEEKRQQLKHLLYKEFPEVFNEDKVDFERLQRVLGESIDTGKERYGLTWPGKADCMKVIQEPSRATLKPCREESVNFDDTENLFIEGDNLEVLKLLQKSYFGKVKMIYIDPPYNTGKEFIYPDNYQETIETYMAYAGLVDDEGKKFSTNATTEGRFHSKWLNMMYPRLYLAKNLLREDGVIFVSIDNNEIENLRRLCNEIFGEENQVSEIIWHKKYAASNDVKGIADMHEYVLVYQKSSKFERKLLPRTEKQNGLYKYDSNDGKGKWRPDNLSVKTVSASYLYPVVNPNTGVEYFPPEGRCWLTKEETMQEWIKDNRVFFGKTGEGAPQLKRYLSEVQQGVVPQSYWSYDEVGHTDAARKQLKAVFDGRPPFDNPKPIGLIQRMLQLTVDDGDILLDFFAGSGTTGDAIIQYLDKKINYILVQLPEPCDEKSDAYKSGFNTISEITKERIRRSGQKVRSGAEQADQLDLGFRVYKLNKSHFSQWQSEVEPGNVEQLQANLELHSNHISEETKQEDLLYELLLKAGFELTESIEQKTFGSQAAFSIAEDALLICLEDRIEPETVEAMVAAEPAEIIVKDSAFAGNDQLKVNAVQTVKAYNQNSETDIVFKVV